MISKTSYQFLSRGRGWFDDPYRHSLASRGLRSRGYLYHGTSSIALDDIRRRGLDPRNPSKFHESSGDYIYLVADEDTAYRWGQIVTPHKGLGLRWWARRHGMGDVPKEELIRARTVVLRVNTDDIEGVLEKDPWGPEEQMSGQPSNIDVSTPYIRPDGQFGHPGRFKNVNQIAIFI